MTNFTAIFYCFHCNDSYIAIASITTTIATNNKSNNVPNEEYNIEKALGTILANGQKSVSQIQDPL